MRDTEKIRALNDAFRSTLMGGRLTLTPGILSRDDADEIIRKVQQFDAFDKNNDPYCEHDFGAFGTGRDSIFWKLDYYSKDLENGSPDPTDPSVTCRVLTIMLAEEY